jgi:hypothetical protein
MHERARVLGGELRVAPDDGGGTAVTLSLPAVAQPESEREPAVPADEPRPGGLIARVVSRTAIADRGLERRP